MADTWQDPSAHGEDTGARGGTNPERQRVQAFVSHVQLLASTREKELGLARARIAALEGELSAARQALEHGSSELAALRGQYEAELKERGERSQELTAQLLREKLAASIDEVRGALLAQYEERIRLGESTLRDKAAEISRLDQLLLQRQLEVAAVKEQAAAEVHSLRQQLETERQAFAAELANTRNQVTEQFSACIRQLEAVAAERDQLVARANETIANLQAEIERMRTAWAADVAMLRDNGAHEHDKAQREIERRDEKLALLTKQVRELESVVASSEDLQRTKTLEREREDLARQSQEQAQRLERVAGALTTLRDICAKSTAVRSILAGARKNFDLDELFSVLE